MNKTLSDEEISSRIRQRKRIEKRLSNLLKIDSASITANVQTYTIFITIFVGKDSLNIVYEIEDRYQDESIAFSIGGLGSIYSTDTERITLYILAGKVAKYLGYIKSIVKEVLENE